MQCNSLAKSGRSLVSHVVLEDWIDGVLEVSLSFYQKDLRAKYSESSETEISCSIREFAYYTLFAL